MKQRILILIIFQFFGVCLLSQEPLRENEGTREDEKFAENADLENDYHLQQLEYYKKQPINLNMAETGELNDLLNLSAMQIENFLHYRKTFGDLIDIYELQAIPGWDLSTIRRLLPYVKVQERNFLLYKNEWRAGIHSIIYRYTRQIEKPGGYVIRNGERLFTGDPARIFLRYSYKYRDAIQYGFAIEKDAGERLIGSSIPFFDFTSFHLMVKRAGLLNNFYLGDFTINMGQGLIQWQGLAVSNGNDAVLIKRQGASIRAYTSAGETFFYRGAAVKLANKNRSLLVFISNRKLDANLGEDSISNENVITSFINSGLHRSEDELRKKNNIRQFTIGGILKARFKKLEFSLNGVGHHFSNSINKKPAPYNLYSITGKNWFNFSLDYGYTFKNLHLFGEGAIDYRHAAAILSGLMISLDKKIDICLLYRDIASSYQAVYGNSITQGNFPNNEKGFFTAISITAGRGWKLEMNADIFKRPWLTFNSDSPSIGSEWIVRVVYRNSKKWELSARYRNNYSFENSSFPISSTTAPLITSSKQQWRIQLNVQPDPALIFRSRFEYLLFKEDDKMENGFMSFVDLLYKPLLKAYSFNLRWQNFETDSYDSRIYAYENDIMYAYSIPSVSGSGSRYYLNLAMDLNNKLTCWVKWSQTIYSESFYSGIEGEGLYDKTRSEFKFQIRYVL